MSERRQQLIEKRIAIESGELKQWSRRGFRHKPKWFRRILETAIVVSFRALGLYQRGRRNALDVRVARLRLEFADLPSEFDGLTVLQIGDVHGDGFPEIGKAIARAVRGAHCDVCLLTGDYRFHVDGPWDGLMAIMEEILAAVSARDGVLGILGNHDSIAMVEPLRKLGIEMLLNESWVLERGDARMVFIGVDDPHYYGCDDIEAAVAGQPNDSFRLLLAHSPEIAEQAASLGVGLYLCGHTHGGQITIPGVGPLVTMSNCPRSITSGVWGVDAMTGYTTRGAGCSGAPLRFNCPAEVALIELRRASG